MKRFDQTLEQTHQGLSNKKYKFLINKKKKVKNIYQYLILIPGINKKSANQILFSKGISKNKRLEDFENSEQNKLLDFIIKNLYIGINIHFDFWYHSFYKVRYKMVKGVRLKWGLPVNGQRTHTNAKTSRKHKFNFRLGLTLRHFKRNNRLII